MTRFVPAIITSLVIMLLLPPVAVGRSSTEGSPLALEPLDDPELPPVGFYRGVLPNPHPGQSFEEVYGNVSLHSQFVPVWGKPSPFYNMSDDLSGSWGSYFVDTLIRGNGMFPLIHMNFYGAGMSLSTPPDLSGAALNDTSWRQRYVESVKSVVNASRPLYLSVGNEVNRWFETYGLNRSDGMGFEHFVSLYNKVYDSVKSLSPGTIVFCTFAREMVAEHREANMSVLSLFDPSRLDMLVLTTYPYSVQGINSVSDIPDDYYSSAFDNIADMPFGLSEAAWPSLSQFGGEDGQVSFIENMTGRLTLDQGLDMKLLGWPWLHDIGPADATGLRFSDGTAKKALSAWKMNDPPSFAPGNRTISLPEDFGYYAYPLNNTFFDTDPGDELSYFLWNGTSYTNLTNTSLFRAEIRGGELLLGSLENVSGTYMLRVMARDRMRETNWTFIQVRVLEINDPPALLDGQGKVTFNEGFTQFMDLSHLITDCDDALSELEITVISAEHLVTIIHMTPDPFMYLYSEDPEWFGETSLLLRVVDTGGEGVVLNISVTILPVEDAPVLMIPNVIDMTEDVGRTLNVSAWWSDPDPGEVLEVTVNVSGGKVGLEPYLDIANGTMELVPDPDVWGTFFLNVTVSDGELNTTGRIEVRIEGVNDPPRAEDPPLLRLVEDETYLFDLDSISPIDVEGETIFFSLANGSDLIRTVSFPENGTMKIVPFPDDFGAGELTVSMRDASGGIAFLVFHFNITAVNDPPFLMTPENWTVYLKRGEERRIDLSGYPFIFEDVDDAPSDLVLHCGSGWCSVNGSWVTIRVPESTNVSDVNLSFRLEDPSGALSEIRSLHLVVLDPLVEGPQLSIGNMTVDQDGGDLIVRANGDEGQEIWVVVVLGNVTLSRRLVEDENTPGTYYLRWKDIPISDDGDIIVYLSREEGGENDSPLEPLVFGFHAREIVEDGNGGGSDTGRVWLVYLGIALLLLIVMFFILRYRSPREDVTSEE